MKQLVYRQERSEFFDVKDSTRVNFRYLKSSLDLFPLIVPLCRLFGLLGLIETGFKLVTRRRQFYCILMEGHVAHYGWVSISFCRYYKVELGDVVVGPIQTDERVRGCGYAALALKSVINELMVRGNRVFWIDTSEINLPSQRVIEKCGFGKPVSRFERPRDGL